jgi:predicted alpha/beta hydrolase
MIETIEITTGDGVRLRGTLYRGGGRDTVVIASALGVARRFYDAFAQYTTSRGLNVITFDYRGIAESRVEKSVFPTMHDWGALDLDAVLGYASTIAPGKLLLVGHSAGGQIFGLAPNLARVARVLVSASGSGYWKHWRGYEKWGLAALWIAMPAVVRVLGYFPSRVLGLGTEDLPRGVAAQWARWGRHPGYILDHLTAGERARYAAFDRPLRWMSYGGDQYAPPAAVDAIVIGYPNAKLERMHVEDRSLGHFDFFRRRSGEPLWPAAFDWLTSE